MATTLVEYQPDPSCRVLVVQGDLTRERVDAIVNAANEELAHGGGVAGAIASAGGPSIQDESDAHVRRFGPVRTGSAAITNGGGLAARYVVHAVGPIWGTGNEDAKLASAVRSSLVLAEQHDCTSIALPAISSGIFGFPKERCATVMLDAIEAFLKAREGAGLTEIRLCNIDDETAEVMRAEVERRVDADG
jgi:O-acetyl-ADP-ribose deacetylase (regulator of RNase III)